MLRTRILTHTEDLNQYIELYQMKAGFKIKLEYLQCSHVRVFYHAQNPEKWVAGYVQNGNGALRYFEKFDTQKRAELLAQMGVNDTDVLETGCMFMDCKNSFKRHQMYFSLLWDAHRANKKAYLGGSVVPKIQNYQMKMMPHLLVNENLIFDGKEMKVKHYYALNGEFFRLSRQLFMYEMKAVISRFFEKYIEKFTGAKNVIKPSDH